MKKYFLIPIILLFVSCGMEKAKVKIITTGETVVIPNDPWLKIGDTIQIFSRKNKVINSGDNWQISEEEGSSDTTYTAIWDATQYEIKKRMSIVISN